MLHTYKYRDLAWIDLESPTEVDVHSLMEQFEIPAFIADELLVPSVRPKVELYKECIYLILHFPDLRHEHFARTHQEIDFIIGKKFIITTHYESIDNLLEFSKIFEVNSILEKSNIGDHAGYIFVYMLKHLYGMMLSELSYLSNSLEEIEANIFKGQEREMVFALSRVGRHLLDFKKAIRLHQEVLESLDTAGKKFFGDEFGHSLKTLSGEYYKIENTVIGNIEALQELRDTNNALLNTKQNEIMQTLTLITVLALPLTLFGVLIQVEMISQPLRELPHGLSISVGFIFLIEVILFDLFKYKKWL